MDSLSQANFKQESTQYLLQALHSLRGVLAAALEKASVQFVPPKSSNPNYLPPLTQLVSTFDLTIIEQKILLLCAGCELDPEFENLCARLNGDPEQKYPTFALALSLFPDFDLGLLDPSCGLQKYQLISIGEGNLISSPIILDRRILHYLLGYTTLDSQLNGKVKPVDNNPNSGYLAQPHLQISKQIQQLLQQNSTKPLIHLCGTSQEILLNIASDVAGQIGVRLYSTSTALLPNSPDMLDEFMFRWRRETFLNRHLLLLNMCSLSPTDSNSSNSKILSQFFGFIETPIIVISSNRLPDLGDYLTTIDVPPLTPNQQREIWIAQLGVRRDSYADKDTSTLEEEIDALVTNFQLTPSKISNAVSSAFSFVDNVDNNESICLKSALWNSCRTQARPSLDNLATRIEAKATWNDLILPEQPKLILKEMIAYLSQRSVVYEKWGFGGKNNRGLGTCALFAGVPGTGKTMAAEVIARELNLDVYKIDLSATVSKYIGETEKNLAKLFDAAEVGGVILLFDEGDALFGKRSEVKDSKDRYANMEISYLLQRLEDYNGLSIITTNIKDALDTAFLRRLRFVVEFPFPDEEERIKIWQRVFPHGVLDIDKSRDFEKLGRLNVAGGNIKSIALRAAFRAAHEGKKIQMIHLLEATQSEYIKLERTLTPNETYDWV